MATRTPLSTRGASWPLRSVCRCSSTTLSQNATPHASDRHHAFILQGAQNLSQELHEQGLRGVFHVERPGHRGPVLKALATRAALVITDAMPLKPLSSWTNAVAEHAPLWQMDCSCVVPMSALKRQATRAFAFRKATLALRQDMLDPWPQVDAHTEAFHGELGFEPVDIERADLATLIAACEIDHSVGPVADTLGGSKAGYARWERFRDGPPKTLCKTAKRRSTPPLRIASLRLSTLRTHLSLSNRARSPGHGRG